MAVLQEAHQQIGPLEHQGAGLQVAAPHLAITVGKAQVQVNPVGRHGALQGDDFQIPLEDGGPGAAGALEGGPGEVPTTPSTNPAAPCSIASCSRLQRRSLPGPSFSGRGRMGGLSRGVGARL